MGAVAEVNEASFGIVNNRILLVCKMCYMNIDIIYKLETQCLQNGVSPTFAHMQNKSFPLNQIGTTILTPKGRREPKRLFADLGRVF
jgi:hypothetical protein